MAATRVQSAFATGTGSKAYASNVASGNLLIAMVHWNGASGDNLNSVTDTQGNTWTVHASTRVYNATIGEHMQIASCTAGSSAACTVTANLSVGTPTSIHVEEYNNAGGSMVFDAGNAATGSSTTLNSGNVTTTAANAMAVAMGNTANSDLQKGADRGPTNGFTQSEAYTSYWFAADAYNLDLGAAGTYSAGWSMPVSVPWSLNIATFKVSGGGGSSGSSSGIAAVSGIGASLSSQPGSISALAAVSGIGASISAQPGSIAGIAAVSGVGASIFAGVGASNGIAAASGVGSSIAAGSAVGAAAGIALVSGIGASIAASVGASGASASAVGISSFTGSPDQVFSGGYLYISREEREAYTRKQRIALGIIEEEKPVELAKYEDILKPRKKKKVDREAQLKAEIKYYLDLELQREEEAIVRLLMEM